MLQLTYSMGPHDVTGLGPSRPLHKRPPFKSAPGRRIGKVKTESTIDLDPLSKPHRRTFC